MLASLHDSPRRRNAASRFASASVSQSIALKGWTTLPEWQGGLDSALGARTQRYAGSEQQFRTSVLLLACGNNSERVVCQRALKRQGIVCLG